MTVVFFVTGASRGIGRALCEALLQRSSSKASASAAADVVVVGLSRGSATLRHERYTHVTADLSDVPTLRDPALPTRFFESSLAGHTLAEPLEKVVLVNNAGLLTTQYMGNFSSSSSSSSSSSPAPASTSSTQYGVSALDELVTCNVTAPMVLCDAFLRTFRASPALKVILNLGSGAAKNVYDGWAPYCASKAALLHFSKVLQKEQDLQRQSLLAKQPASTTNPPPGAVKVLCIAPGVVATDMLATVVSSATDPAQFSRLPEMQQLQAGGVFQPVGQAVEKLLRMVDHAEEYTEVDLHS